MAFQVISKNYLDTLIAQQLLHFFRIPLLPSETVSSNNLALYLKDLKALLFPILALQLVASSLE